MRAGILESLSPFFVEGDSFSGVLMHTIKRMLQKADIVDLTNVLISADSFIEEMRPYLTEYENFRDGVLGADNDTETAEERFNREAYEINNTPQAPVSDDGEAFDRGDDTDSGGRTDGPGDTDWEDEIRQVHSTLIHHQDIHEEIPTSGESPSDRHQTTLERHNSSNGSATGTALS